MIYIYIYIFFTIDDLSYNKAATQTHTFPGNFYDANNAVDRVVATCMRTEDIGLSSPYNNVKWMVDLGRVFNIYSITIVFKHYDTYGNYSFKKFDI